MKKLKEIMFVYDDGSADCIQDPRACLLFQSRCNTSGVLSGLEDYISPVVDLNDRTELGPK